MSVKQQVIFIGWADACDRHGDHTGISHMLKDKDGVGVTVCGSRSRTFGQVENHPAGNACDKCTKAVVKSRWPKAHAVRYAHNNSFHINDGYGGYACDLGSGGTEAVAWWEAYDSENARKSF